MFCQKSRAKINIFPVCTQHIFQPLANVLALFLAICPERTAFQFVLLASRQEMLADIWLAQQQQ